MNESWRTHRLEYLGGGEAPDPWESEWLLTNGTGAYAMGTVAGVNTRRYHGLLVAATRPPVGRVVVLNQIIERLTIGEGETSQTLDLTGCLFRGTERDSRGNEELVKRIKRFEKGLSVRWMYQGVGPGEVGSFELTREVLLYWQEQAVSVRYGVRWSGGAGSGGPVVLSLEPLLTLRDFHSLLHMREAGPVSVGPKPGGVATVWRGELSATVKCGVGRMTPLRAGADPFWHDIYYPLEAGRGQEGLEDNIAPVRYVVDLPEGETREFVVTVALGDVAAESAADEEKRVGHLEPIRQRIEKIVGGNTEDTGVVGRGLAIAADDFVVSRDFGGRVLATVLAGYPWFADWGRDTFISLPGLLLTTGRFEEARGVLHTFAGAIRNGLVPNRFDDYSNEAAHYNAVDASLWFVHAAMAYYRATRDQESWDGWLRGAAVEVIEAYIRGTDFEIRMAGDALITAGTAGTQLTWMDAARDGVVFTPRHGKAVEVNALWYSNLSGMSELLAESDRSASEHYRKLTQRISRSFTKLFWEPKRGCLNDHVWVDGEGHEHADATVRPNQIFAVSLPFSPLPRTRQKKVLAVVREQLLTPYGLRTLPEDDPDYHGRYRGTMFERDSAYHRGTVWPWLIGPYAEAVLRVGDFSAKARDEAWKAIGPLLGRLMSNGLGQLHEIHEGDPPHAAVGCIAQAWSVAEVVRVLGLLEEMGEK